MGQRPHLLVVTSTYPRWTGDATPAFVQHFARAVAGAFRGVTVLAPHFPGAATRERDGQLDVRRYRYWWPERAETIAYEGGALGKLGRSPTYAVRLVALLAAMAHHVFWRAVRRRPVVVNPHWLIPQGFVAVLVSRLTRAAVVVTVHGGDVFALTGPLMSRLKRFTLQRADAVVVNSSATLAACRALAPHVDYHLIPMGVHTDRLQPRASERAPGPLRALFVGRLAPRRVPTTSSARSRRHPASRPASSATAPSAPDWNASPSSAASPTASPSTAGCRPNGSPTSTTGPTCSSDRRSVPRTAGRRRSASCSSRPCRPARR